MQTSDRFFCIKPQKWRSSLFITNGSQDKLACCGSHLAWQIKEGDSNLLVLLHVQVHYSITNTPNFCYIEHCLPFMSLWVQTYSEKKALLSSKLNIYMSFCQKGLQTCRMEGIGQIQFSFTIRTLEVSRHIIWKVWVLYAKCQTFVISP